MAKMVYVSQLVSVLVIIVVFVLRPVYGRLEVFETRFDTGFVVCTLTVLAGFS